MSLPIFAPAGTMDRMNRSTTPAGFTLVELLVVITIIVILLAMLAPALDKAVYFAELSLCAANQHAIGNGAQIYAVDHARRYPDRSRALKAEPNYASNWLTEPESDLDLRPILSGYMSIKAFMDPLSPNVNVQETGRPEDRDTYVHSNNSFYFGWQFQAPAPHAGMLRLNDRFGWKDRRFSVLVADLDWNTVGYTVTLSSHADRDGILFEEVVQDVQEPVSASLLGYPTGRFTFGRWIQISGQERGELDMNFASSDGSVERFDHVQTDDPRMVKVPLPAHDQAEFQLLPPK
jgi:prepilin-type N-terminal cleavage/methylation domain-containing protein